jgi:hypothetical protein
MLDKVISDVNPQSTIVLTAKGRLLKVLNKDEEADDCFKKAEEAEVKKSEIIKE